LNLISREIVDSLGGIPIQATIEEMPTKSVKEYYGITVSHRFVAENASLGWRGKTSLLLMRSLATL